MRRKSPENPAIVWRVGTAAARAAAAWWISAMGRRATADCALMVMVAPLLFQACDDLKLRFGGPLGRKRQSAFLLCYVLSLIDILINHLSRDRSLAICSALAPLPASLCYRNNAIRHDTIEFPLHHHFKARSGVKGGRIDKHEGWQPDTLRQNALIRSPSNAEVYYCSFRTQ